MADKRILSWIAAAPFLGVRAGLALALLAMDRVCAWLGFKPYMTDLLDEIASAQREIEAECEKGKRVRDEIIATQQETISLKDESIAELEATTELQRELIADLRKARGHGA